MQHLKVKDASIQKAVPSIDHWHTMEKNIEVIPIQPNIESIKDKTPIIKGTYFRQIIINLYKLKLIDFSSIILNNYLIPNT